MKVVVRDNQIEKAIKDLKRPKKDSFPKSRRGVSMINPVFKRRKNRPRQPKGAASESSVFSL
jgi:hypothetical protein